MTSNRNPIPEIGSDDRIEYEARRGRDGSRFLRFTPARAVRELQRPEATYILSKPWSALTLISWAYLCPRARKITDGERRLIFSRDARRAGNLLLLHELHNTDRGRDDHYKAIMKMFTDTEGFANAIVGSPSWQLLDEFKEADSTVRLVVEIARYLARADTLPKNKGSIEDAKFFVSKYSAVEAAIIATQVWPKAIARVSRGSKKLEADWLKFKGAVPYLFALHSDAEFSSSLFTDFDKFLGWTKMFAADADRVQRFLGMAASMSDTLGKVRKADFKGVKRIALELQPFTKEEMDFVLNTSRPRIVDTRDPSRTRTKPRNS
jgi:hypothetical protein